MSEVTSDDIRRQQERYARAQLQKEARLAQSESDRAEVKIKLIKNGYLVKMADGWEAYPTWDEAAREIGAALATMRKTG